MVINRILQNIRQTLNSLSAPLTPELGGNDNGEIAVEAVPPSSVEAQGIEPWSE
jgi:hypothetical protein